MDCPNGAILTGRPLTNVDHPNAALIWRSQTSNIP